MFCKNCGQQLDDNAVVCPHCGVATDNFKAAPAQQSAPVNGYAIAGLVLGLIGFFGGGYLFCIVPLLGVIFSGIGLKKSKETGSGHGIAVGGLVVSIISLVFWIFIWAFAGGILIAALINAT